MNKETIKQKLSVIISNNTLTGNEKRDKILQLFDDAHMGHIPKIKDDGKHEPYAYDFHWK